MRLAFDHLVYATDDLISGKRAFEDLTGGLLPASGCHVKMATHNALGAIDQDSYIELIAIDPKAKPSMPRWFGLDDDHIKTRIKNGPQLLTWVINCDDIHAAINHYYAVYKDDMRVFAMERGAHRWLFADRADGKLNNNGLMPHLIQWLTPPPVKTMPSSELVLKSLNVSERERSLVNALNDCRLNVDDGIDSPSCTLLKM